MKKRCLSIVLVLCMMMGMVPAISVPAVAAAADSLMLPKGSGSGKGFIYYNFEETTQFDPGTTYAFLDGVYGIDDAVAQLGSGAVLEATSVKNNCEKYMNGIYANAKAETYVNVVEPGKGFDHCPTGGLYKMPETSNPTEYRYFCRAGGAQDCGPLYAYTYRTAEITWDNVTVYLNDPGDVQSNDSADYTVELNYAEDKAVALDPRSYTVLCSGRTATITITDNDGNTIQGTVTLPCGVIYQPGGTNVVGMPANQGMLSGSVEAASAPTRTGYEFQHWTDGAQTYEVGAVIPYKADGNYTLTAVWKDIQAPEFTCEPVEVTTGTSGEVVQNSIEAALKITDNEPVSECTVKVAADDITASTRGEKQVSVTVTDKAGNVTTKEVTLKVLPGPLTFGEPSYIGGTLSVTLLEPGSDTLTETGIVWSIMNNPTTTVNNGKYTTESPATDPNTVLSTSVELAEGVTYYARAYAKVGDITYYGPQSTIGDSIPSYGVFTITNDGSNTFTVSRSGGSDGVQTVYYRTVNGSAVGGTHFTHQSGTLTFAAGEATKTITVTEQGVNAAYDGNTATGYSNDSRTYSVEIYRVDGGAVIENNRDEATCTMMGNTVVDRTEFDQKTWNGDGDETERGDYDKDGQKGWTDNARGSEQDKVVVQPTDKIRSYMQTVSDEIRFFVTFEAREGESGYQAVQIVPGSETDIGIYPYDNTLKNADTWSSGDGVGYTALFEHGGDTKDTNWASYRFPVNASDGAEIATTANKHNSKLTKEAWKGNDTGDYIAFPATTEQVTVSYGACGEDSDQWYTKYVVYHYQFIDTKDPTLLAIGGMGESTYRVGDRFTVSLIFDEIVDSTNSTLSGKTITTSWGTATYAGGVNTNVLYFTGTVTADATDTLSVTGIDSTAVIKDMAGNAASSVSGNTTADVDTKTPSFDLSQGSISGGVARATISNANENTTSLRYAWSQSTTMPATGWVPLTSGELEDAKTSEGFQPMTRQEPGSGTWYLHVIGVCETNGALVYKNTSANFGTGGGIPGDPEPAQPSPTISVAVDNTSWAKSRTITVTAANGTVEYRYGTEAWQKVSGDSVTVEKNGTYTFRCVSSSGEAATASAEVSKLDTIAPIASIGDMTANTPTQKNGVYHSITLPIEHNDTQSGVKTVEYQWSNSATADVSGWSSVGTDETQLIYEANETSETAIYLHLRVTDQVGNTVTVHSQAYQVISEEGAKAYAPTITLGLASNGGNGFTPWDGKTWTNETQTLVWKLVGEHTDHCVVTLPDGRTTTETSGTILVSQNGEYTVSVMDNTYGGSNSASYTIDKIDTIAPAVSHTEAPVGWQPSAVTVNFTFADQGGSGLGTAKYQIVKSNSETPTDLISFDSTSSGSVTISEDGTWYIYYEVTDNTAGTYGDGTSRPANTTSGFVGPIQINTGKPDLNITGGTTGASSLVLTVVSDVEVKVSKDGGQAQPVSGSTYTVTEAGTYTFTAPSNAGLTTEQTVQVHSITFDSGVEKQLVVSGGTATEPSEPTRPGFTFTGWMNGQTVWNFADQVKTNITLTAGWELHTPAVELTADKTEVTYGEEISLTADVTFEVGDDTSITYAWYKDDSATPISGESDSTLTLSQVSQSGTYKVTVTVQGDGQTKTVDSNEISTTIHSREVSITWQGLNQVYGETVDVEPLYSGVVGDDDVTVDVTGIGQTAGSYPLTATLNGEDSVNYHLKNSTATLTIQPKPVIFTVAKNTVQADGTVKGADVTPNDGTFSSYTVFYRQNGQEISAPTEVGSYEIWVKLTDSNYRHTDGSDFMQVGTLSITQAPPVLYTASFVGGEGSTGDAPAQQSAPANGQIIVPVNPFDKRDEEADYSFTGWKVDGDTKLYQPGESFVMPSRDVTFTAQWQKTFTVSGVITEEGSGEQGVEQAVVSLWLGANKIGETTTDSNGAYSFNNLIPGIYNLVVTKDVRTVTSKVEITAEDKICNATLPKGATNSVVEVAPGSPDIVVGSLDKVFAKTDPVVYTEDDAKKVAEQGYKVEITFTAKELQNEDQSISSDMSKIEGEKDSNVTLGLVMDYKLDKKVFDADNREDTKASKNITQSNVLLEILLPLPAEMQGKTSYAVYRVHSSTGQEVDKQAEELKQRIDNANSLGEYFTVNSDKTVLTLHVKCFSTYAIGYGESSGNNGGGSGGWTTPTYPPIIEKPEHGSVTVEPSSPEKGDDVLITVTPEEGYTVGEVTVTGPDGEPVEVTPDDDGNYTFVQPDGKVTITVTFQKKNTASECPRDDSCPMAVYSDTDMSAWYHDGVHYCVEHGLMVGIGKTTFSPNTSLSRAMVAQILYNMEGQPAVTGENTFTDVDSADWWNTAVTWAQKTGVVSGYDDQTFRPDHAVSREELAQMLYNYAKYKGYDLTASGDLSAFPDGNKVSNWAVTAMAWANGNGIINGSEQSDGSLLLIPGGNATRAQAASMLMNFDLHFVK